MRVYLILLILSMAACNGSQVGNLQAPSKLTCEYLDNPEVVDVTPRLGWVNSTTASQRAEVQKAYQIRVASSERQLGDPDLWDSDKVVSNESIRVEYKGKELTSGQDCF